MTSTRPALTVRELPSWSSIEPDILVNVVDRLATVRPSAPYIYYPINPVSYVAGFRTVTWGIFANIINGLAEWLHKEFGPAEAGFPTLAYVGTNDVRYNGLILAANKVGYKMFLTSPRNSPASHASLFKASKSRALLVSDPSIPGLAQLAAACDLKLIQVPSLDDLYNKKYPVYPYHKQYATSKEEPLVVLHTSGTTGHPKLVTWTHETGPSILMNTFHADTPAGYEVFERFIVGKKYFCPLPPFHAAGCGWSLFWPCFLQTQAIIPIQGTIPTVQLITDGLQFIEADFALLAPTMPSEIQKRPELLDFLAERLEFMFYAGGDISEAQGDFITAKIPFFPGYGGTDVCLLPSLHPTGPWNSEDWKYLYFHDAAGIEFEKGIYDNDAYEIVIRRNPGKEAHQPVFSIFPDLNEYRNGDLLVKHPTKNHLWQYKGRSDDIIVYSTGEKHNPITMEQHITRHPQISSALVCGSQRFQSALIIELAEKKELDERSTNELLESIWSYVEEANQECPKHARISKSLIMIAPPDKSFFRAGKGTVQRRPTVESFEKELEELYSGIERLENKTDGHNDVVMDLSSPSALAAYVRTQILTQTKWPAVKDDENLFIYGLDSLQSLALTRKVRKDLNLSDLSPALLFTHPNVKEYTAALWELVETREQHRGIEKSGHRHENLQTVLKKHIQNVNKLTPKKQDLDRSSQHSLKVILTGSTGFIGSYILASLLINPAVQHIFCVNRSEDSAHRQMKRIAQRGTNSDLDFSRVSFHQGIVSKENFGLKDSLFDKLCAEASHIIHAAWPVDFNMPLSYFDASLDGVDRLVEFANAAKNPVSFTFLSSIGAVLNLPQHSISEEIHKTPAAPSLNGYGESKYLAEQILAHAASKLNLDVRIMRIGQVAAPAHSQGIWNELEWFPRLIRSSVTLQAIPESLPGDVINWVPIDVLADVLTELAFASRDSQPKDTPQVFQPINGNIAHWEVLRNVAANVIESRSVYEIKKMPLQQWVDLVRADAEKPAGHGFANGHVNGVDGGLGNDNAAGNEEQTVQVMLRRNPAASLLDWFDSMAKKNNAKSFENAKARKASPTLEGLGAVDATLMAKWVTDILKDF